MIVTAKLKRVFLFENKGQVIPLSDPSPKLTPEQVLNFYSPTYPMLTIAKIEPAKQVGAEIQFQFTVIPGTKG